MSDIAFRHCNVNSLDDAVLVLSQDYELFFGVSGTVEKCIFEPCDALLKVANRLGIRITFFVDAGMIVAADRLAPQTASMSRLASRLRRHISGLAAAGHEIALHIHPHWQDTRWNGRWDFSKTRYRLCDFSAAEAGDVIRSYSDCLGGITGDAPTAYRAGGFCIDPFELIAADLCAAGISVDSSVVPGARLADPVKGFDFSDVPQDEWWRFDESPLDPVPGGAFIELPVTAQSLPVPFYWGRLLRRLSRRPIGNGAGNGAGDGSSMGIGRAEILRRLAGLSRVAELSIDAPKAPYLLSHRVRRMRRAYWQVMGHPKLLSVHSLACLEQFVADRGFRRFETVSGLAATLGPQRRRHERRVSA